MAGVTGLEPATSGVTGQRSNQLSYTPKQCVRSGLGHSYSRVKQQLFSFFTCEVQPRRQE